MGTKIKIQKGFVKPPVNYNKEINCKRSNNKYNKIKDMVANRLKSTSIIE